MPISKPRYTRKIAVDNLSTESPGEEKSQRTFARSGGPQDGDKRPHAGSGHFFSVPPEALCFVATSDIVNEYLTSAVSPMAGRSEQETGSHRL